MRVSLEHTWSRQGPWRVTVLRDESGGVVGTVSHFRDGRHAAWAPGFRCEGPDGDVLFQRLVGVLGVTSY